MKLYVWEGNGISSAYHDDGTLVALAESPEQAREVVRRMKAEEAAWDDEMNDRRMAWHRSGERAWMADHGVRYGEWDTDGGRELLAIRESFDYPGRDLIPDGSMDREPDRIVDLDVPTIVAFNGGGYD